MAKTQRHKNLFAVWMDHTIDCCVTLVCWTWFILGYLLFYSWRYLASAIFDKNHEKRIQSLNSRFFQIFFRIVKATAPRHRIVIAPQVAAIRSSVIVCNHLSYLDPLLMIALYEQHRTIVKTRFFSMPIFGWVIKKAGYLPAKGEGRFARMMITQMESMASFFQAGGNLFVFPEGTRSRDGKLGKFEKGALKIARMHKVPIYVLKVSNTNRLFSPGKFLFNTRIDNTITMSVVDHITPDYRSEQPTTAQFEEKVRQAYRRVNL